MPKEDPFVNRAQLLKAIKRYPEIWDSNNKLHMCRSVTSPMWNEIAEQFGGQVPTVKLQSIWSQMKYHYHNLVHRQILHKDRFTTKWEHFEPMSFMYNITVAKIVGATATPTDTDDQQQAPPSTPPPQGRGRPSGSFTWVPQNTSIPITNEATLLESGSFTGFTGLVPPAVITVETTTTPLRKPGRPGSMNNGMRAKIIDALRDRPTLWAGRQREQRQGQNRTSAVWKEVAAQLGLSASLVQTRWSIIKQRYVDELQKERHNLYQQQPFHSNWEHFERMSFMREILLRKVDDREQTRERIQEIVSEQQQGVQPQQHLRYVRTASNAMGGLVGANQLICDDGEVCVGELQHVVIGGGVAGDGAVVGGIGVGGRRRVKAESDLEWDPFEMILHVHGAEHNN